MKHFCDLHTHSYYSDGTFAPEQLLRQAQQLGLSAIALTDHNTVAGLPEFLAAGERYNVEAIPGIEITREVESPLRSNAHLYADIHGCRSIVEQVCLDGDILGLDIRYREQKSK